MPSWAIKGGLLSLQSGQEMYLIAIPRVEGGFSTYLGTLRRVQKRGLRCHPILSNGA